MCLSSDLYPSEVRKPPWQVCGVSWVLSEVTGGDREIIEKAIWDPNVSSRKVARAIAKNLGLAISDQAVLRHRGGICRCGK
jgi:hypothetical protein